VMKGHEDGGYVLWNGRKLFSDRSRSAFRRYP
jgi:hypothetical protein